MTQVRVSSKYQVVIPKEVRRQAGLERGVKLTVLFKDGIITLAPQRPLEELKGILRGIDSGHIREKKDRH